MKKHSLLKFMGIILLLVLIASYFIPARTGAVSYLPFGDLVSSVKEDMQILLDSPLIPDEIEISGGIYNVDTGLITEVQL